MMNTQSECDVAFAFVSWQTTSPHQPVCCLFHFLEFSARNTKKSTLIKMMRCALLHLFLDECKAKFSWLVAGLIFHAFWQEMNQNDNTNNESALTRWSRRRKSVGLHKHNNDERKMNNRKGCQMSLQEGAGGQKFQLGCVLFKSIHSSPRVKD